MGLWTVPAQVWSSPLDCVSARMTTESPISPPRMLRSTRCLLSWCARCIGIGIALPWTPAKSVAVAGQGLSLKLGAAGRRWGVVSYREGLRARVVSSHPVPVCILHTSGPTRRPVVHTSGAQGRKATFGTASLPGFSAWLGPVRS